MYWFLHNWFPGPVAKGELNVGSVPAIAGAC